MTKSILTLITRGIAASGMFAALAIAQRAPHYIVTDLGTLGGTYSYGYGINHAGWVGGGAATVSQTGGVAQTALLWHGGEMTNLGTLGGPSSEVGGGPNLFGELSIISETSVTDPNGEDFCGFGTHLQCLGAIWKNGAMTALPTLPGGNNGQAYWVNDEGQVIGFAENGTRDSTCASVTPSQVLRFEALIWGRKGEVRDLRPLKGDTVGFAFGINDKGQVVGTSGLCYRDAAPKARDIQLLFTDICRSRTLWAANLGRRLPLGSLRLEIYPHFSGYPGATDAAMMVAIRNGGSIVGIWAHK